MTSNPWTPAPGSRAPSAEFYAILELLTQQLQQASQAEVAQAAAVIEHEIWPLAKKRLPLGQMRITCSSLMPVWCLVFDEPAATHADFLSTLARNPDYADESPDRVEAFFTEAIRLLRGALQGTSILAEAVL